MATVSLTLVEGAGGVLSPLTWERSAVDLAQALDARVPYRVKKASRGRVTERVMTPLEALARLAALVPTTVSEYAW